MHSTLDGFTWRIIIIVPSIKKINELTGEENNHLKSSHDLTLIFREGGRECEAGAFSFLCFLFFPLDFCFAPGRPIFFSTFFSFFLSFFL